jgi:hypothetical protein
MSRKHFNQAARIARGYVYPHRLSIAEAFAELFAQENPAFDRARFYAACSLTPDGKSVHTATPDLISLSRP